MGNDAQLLCLDCEEMEHLGRAHNYNRDAMDKEIPKDLLDKLKIINTRVNMSLRNTGLYEEQYYNYFFEDIIDFLKQHKGHKVILIDDYYEERQEKTCSRNNTRKTPKKTIPKT